MKYISKVAVILLSLTILIMPLSNVYAGKILSKDNVKKAATSAAAMAVLEKMKPKDKDAQDKKEAKKEAKKAAKKEAKEKKEALKQADTDALEKVKTMAENGDIQAQYILGLAYFTGQQIKADDMLAVEWWRKASDGGHPEADAYMGLAYATGIGKTLISPEVSKKRYLRAEQNGSALAKVILGIEDYAQNTPEAKKAAMKRFQAAASEGQVQAKEFLRLVEQKGTDSNLKLGKDIDWKKEAQKTPLTALYTEAGTNAFWGRIVSQDYTSAVAWWEMAVKQDNPTAQALLGTAYYTGRGIDQDEKAAVELFKAAAVKAEPLAQYMLGKAYLAGNVVQRDKTLALQLFEAAAAAGIADAQQQADALKKMKIGTR